MTDEAGTQEQGQGTATQGTQGSTEGTTQSAAADVASMVSDQTAAADAGTAEESRPEWCPEKFWDSEGKAARVEQMAKSYGELEGKMGSFTGAPDEYTIAVSEEVKEKGVEIDNDHPMIPEFTKTAKEMGMNQDGVNTMIDMLGMYELAQKTAENDALLADIATLGDNADRRLKNLNDWAKANLSEDMIPGFQDLAGSSGAVKALEHVISMTRAAPITPDTVTPGAGISAEEVNAMQFEKDEHGNRRIQTDPEFAKRFREKSDLLHGTGEFREIIGK